MYFLWGRLCVQTPLVTNVAALIGQNWLKLPAQPSLFSRSFFLPEVYKVKANSSWYGNTTPTRTTGGKKQLVELVFYHDKFNYHHHTSPGKLKFRIGKNKTFRRSLSSLLRKVRYIHHIDLAPGCGKLRGPLWVATPVLSNINARPLKATLQCRDLNIEWKPTELMRIWIRTATHANPWAKKQWESSKRCRAVITVSAYTESFLHSGR